MSFGSTSAVCFAFEAAPSGLERLLHPPITLLPPNVAAAHAVAVMKVLRLRGTGIGGYGRTLERSTTSIASALNSSKLEGR
jgi:hypothetical protein